MKSLAIFNKLYSRKTAIVIGSLILIYVLLRIFIFETDPLYGLIIAMFNGYLFLIEGLANEIFKSLNSGVEIVNHNILFDQITNYTTVNAENINNWTSLIFFKKWSVLLLMLIWFVSSSIKKKLFFTGLLLVTHYFSAVSGLFLLCVAGPVMVNTSALSELYPNILGSLAMITFFVIWLKNNISEVYLTLNKLKIKKTLSKKTLNEIIIIIFIFSLLKNFIVPYFNFYNYIYFLLTATKATVSLFGYEPTIDGPYLIGQTASLFMAKWCLGFITMFLFSSLVYLTGKIKKNKWIFIISGIIFLHVVNIIRLATLFIYVQNNDIAKAENHHNIYNIIVYIIIFILWIIFFEKYAGIRSSRKKVV